TPMAGVDHEHANDGPSGFKEWRLWAPRRNVDDRADDPVGQFRDDHFAIRRERRRLADAGGHRRPVGIMQLELLEGGERHAVDLRRVGRAKIAQGYGGHGLVVTGCHSIARRSSVWNWSNSNVARARRSS